MSEYSIVRKQKGSKFQYRIERRVPGAAPAAIQVFWSREEAEEALEQLRGLGQAGAWASPAAAPSPGLASTGIDTDRATRPRS